MKEKKKSLFEEYEIMERLGEGANARVFKVKHLKLDYIRAIKVLNQFIDDEEDPKYMKFIEECRTLLRLGNGGHKNIISITLPRLLKNHAVVEMDYVQGKDLDEFLQDSQRFLPIDEVLNLMTDISDALRYCHYSIFSYCIDRDVDRCVTDSLKISEDCERSLVEKYKIIHNDIHSRNIRRRTDGRYVLLDFGLAIEQGRQVKSSSRKAGAPEYKAPEKWENEMIFTEQVDIYSFGILMYEALAGNVPFPLKNQSEQAIHDLMMHHTKSKPDPIEHKRKAAFEKTHNTPWKKDYPDWIEPVIMKCLEKDPAARYKNGKELFEEIQKHLSVKTQTAAEVEKLAREKFDQRIAELQGANDTLYKKFKQAQAEPRRAKQEYLASGTIASFVFIVIAICILTGLITYQIGKSESENESQTAVTATDNIEIFGSKDYGVKFYNTASFASPKVARITTREIVPVLKDSNGFVFIIFTNSDNVETQGWINKMEASEESAKRSRLADSLVKAAPTASSSKHFIVAIDLYKRAQEIRPRKEINFRIERLAYLADSLANMLEIEITEKTEVNNELSNCDPAIILLYDSILRMVDRPRIQRLKDSCTNAGVRL